jgi:hypothetical protein
MGVFRGGKQISLIIGYGTGGGYDLYARLLARFIGDHIPGKPTIVAQNMPGAGSRRAANWLYKVAPKDGTVIATVSQTTPIDQVLDQPGIQFDVQRFNWIGNMVVVNNIMFVSAATGVRTIDDAKKTPLAIGCRRGAFASGALSPGVEQPIWHQVQDRLWLFRWRRHQPRRREVEGRGSDSWASLKANKPDWLRDRTVNVLFQTGPRREIDLPDVPLWSELGQDDEQRLVLEVLSGDVAVGRPIVTAPEVPVDPSRPTCTSTR